MDNRSKAPKSPYAYFHNLGAVYSEAELLYFNSDVMLDGIVPYPQAFSWYIDSRDGIVQRGNSGFTEQLVEIREAVNVTPGVHLLSSNLSDLYRHYLGTELEPIVASALRDERVWALANEQADIDSILSVIEPGQLLVIDNDSPERPDFCDWLRRALHFGQANHDKFRLTT